MNQGQYNFYRKILNDKGILSRIASFNGVRPSDIANSIKDMMGCVPENARDYEQLKAVAIAANMTDEEWADLIMSTPTLAQVRTQVNDRRRAYEDEQRRIFWESVYEECSRSDSDFDDDIDGMTFDDIDEWIRENIDQQGERE